MLIYEKIKEWGERASPPISSIIVDRSSTPKNHRTINKLQIHKRTSRTGSKPDTGRPGRPPGW